MLSPTFRDDFEQFVHSLAAKDRSTFNRFLDERAFSFAILPPSRTFDSLNDYERSQDHWFGGATGTFVYTVERVQEGADLALGVIKASYSNVDSNSNPFTLELWISFVFKKVNRLWKMVYVQNTQIQQ